MPTEVELRQVGETLLDSKMEREVKETEEKHPSPRLSGKENGVYLLTERAILV